MTNHVHEFEPAGRCACGEHIALVSYPAREAMGWAWDAVLALAKRILSEERPEDGWHDLVASSQSGYLRRACEEAGIDWPRLRDALLARELLEEP